MQLVAIIDVSLSVLRLPVGSASPVPLFLPYPHDIRPSPPGSMVLDTSLRNDLSPALVAQLSLLGLSQGQDHMRMCYVAQ